MTEQFQDLLLDEIKCIRCDVKEIKIAVNGTGSEPGLRIKVDRLEQQAVNRRRHLHYLWTAIGALAVGWILDTFKAIAALLHG